MNTQSGLPDPRASTMQRLGGVSDLPPPPRRENPSSDNTSSQRPQPAQYHVDSGQNDSRENEPRPERVPRSHSTSQGLSLPSFREAFGDFIAPQKESTITEAPREIHRDTRTTSSELSHSLSRLNRPLYGPSGPAPPQEQKRRSFSSDPLSRAPGSLSRKRKLSVEEDRLPPLYRHHSEGLYSGSREPPRKHSVHTLDPRPESSGFAGSQNSSGRSSPSHGLRVLQGLPRLDTHPRGLEATRFHESPNYTYDSSRPGAHTFPQASGAYPPPPTADSYNYQPPRHSYSYSGPSHSSSYQPQHAQYYSHHQAQDQSPLSTTPHHGNDYIDGYVHNQSGMRENSMPRQRKRRGNLPKETTDRLRTWFHSNINHAYPTEEQKQDLMHETGLQMNQISNWFINARRRKLPEILKAQEEMERRQQAEQVSLAKGQSTDLVSALPDGKSGQGSGQTIGGLVTPSDSLTPGKSYQSAINSHYRSEDDEADYLDDPSPSPSRETQLVHHGLRKDINTPLDGRSFDQQRPQERTPLNLSAEVQRGYVTQTPTPNSDLNSDRRLSRR